MKVDWIATGTADVKDVGASSAARGCLYSLVDWINKTCCLPTFFEIALLRYLEPIRIAVALKISKLKQDLG